MERLESFGRMRMPRPHEINYKSVRCFYEQSQNELNCCMQTCKQCKSNPILNEFTKDEDTLCIKCKLDFSVDKDVDDIFQNVEWNELYAHERSSERQSVFYDEEIEAKSTKNLYRTSINENTQYFDTCDFKKSSKQVSNANETINNKETKYNNENDIPLYIGMDLSYNYDTESLIGSGKFGKVYKVKNRLTGRIAAAKQIPYRSMNAKDSICNEVEILKLLSNDDHILKLFEIIDSCHTLPKKMIIISEYLDGGNLFNEIAKDELLTEIEVSQIIKQILEGVSFIHNRNIIHRDLKPENIMYESKEIKKIKIIDFGLAVRYNESNPPKSMVGTTIFVAPEVLKYENQSYKTDIWSIGVIAYDLLAGITPFEIPRSGDLDRELTDNEIMTCIQKCQYDFEDEGFIGVSETAKTFISKVLILDPKKRMTSEECLKDPWLTMLQPKKKKMLIRKMSLMRMKNYLSTNKFEKRSTAV